MASMNTRLNIEKLDRNIVQKHGGSKQVGFKQLGYKQVGFKQLGVKQVGFKQLGYKQVGFKQLGVKQVGFKQLGSSVKTRVHGVQVDKCVWFEVELQGAQGNREAEVFQVSNDDAAVAQRWLEDKQLEEKTNTDCLVKEQEKENLVIKVGANIMVIGVPSQEGAEGGPRFEVSALDEDAEYRLCLSVIPKNHPNPNPTPQQPALRPIDVENYDASPNIILISSDDDEDEEDFVAPHPNLYYIIKSLAPFLENWKLSYLGFHIEVLVSYLKISYHRFMRFLENKQEEGEFMRNSIDNGPYKRKEIPNPNNAQATIPEPVNKMSKPDKDQYFADIKLLSGFLVIFVHLSTIHTSKHRLEIRFHVEKRLEFLRGVGRKDLGKELANESGLKFILRFDSSFVEFVLPDSEEFMNVFVRIGFGSIIKLVSCDESQVVTFNSKFVCGFRMCDCETESRSDNMVGSPHGFVIYRIEVLKGNEKVMEVIDVKN
uniref:Uncharacterized protein n=1 Tax=Tanacetum cinerariifolium TaxID=118510 RepID=A0A6L2MQC4_TANCI|nr:hypothetical protein [Tanacetum cinerariifolium]